MNRKQLLTLALQLAPVTLFAADESGSRGEGWLAPIWGVPMIVWQLVNLALVVALFYYLLKVRLPAFFKNRAIEIENALKKAREEEAVAKQKLQELEDKMDGLEEEISKIRRDAGESAEREKAALRKKAEDSASWLRAEAEEEFKKRERDAEKRLREAVVSEAIAMARAMIGQSLNDADKEKAFSEFSKELRDKADG